MSFQLSVSYAEFVELIQSATGDVNLVRQVPARWSVFHQTALRVAEGGSETTIKSRTARVNAPLSRAGKSYFIVMDGSGKYVYVPASLRKYPAIMNYMLTVYDSNSIHLESTIK